MAGRPTDAEVEAAARLLFAEGAHHHWWAYEGGYDDLDPIGKDEFDAIVERVLMAAAKVSNSAR